jgi:hypothetical protein
LISATDALPVVTNAEKEVIVDGIRLVVPRVLKAEENGTILLRPVHEEEPHASA